MAKQAVSQEQDTRRLRELSEIALVAGRLEEALEFITKSEVEAERAATMQKLLVCTLYVPLYDYLHELTDEPLQDDKKTKERGAKGKSPSKKNRLASHNFHHHLRAPQFQCQSSNNSPWDNSSPLATSPRPLRP